jgi:hypothetical protein
MNFVIRSLAGLIVGTLVSGCASTIQVSSLAKPVNASDTVSVTGFSYAKGLIGLDSGVYKIEHENADGYFYRGPGLPVLLAPPLNMNRASFPDDKFPGGLFVPRSRDPKGYRVYYYQLNTPGSPNPTAPVTAGSANPAMAVPSETITAAIPAGASPAAAGIGGGIAGGLISYMIESGRGQIVLTPGTDEIVISSYVSRP